MVTVPVDVVVDAPSTPDYGWNDGYCYYDHSFCWWWSTNSSLMLLLLL
jgi:hypothetical protein